ncbi:kinase-like protein [Rhizophagus irregularis]|uniref:Kinase-like protein n=1 Tax=Rhizophagus irregularis TaxID=588596 RepID=A0A2I1GTX4_9GLOM|nr:kinase-like protein [Rhizophagus irregularis]
MLSFELDGEAKERYTIVRSYNYGNELNVYKVHKKNDPETHYMLKSYKTREDFERESQMLRELHGAKNIVQMIDVYPLQSIIVCESALYDLEIFLHHQNNIQRQEEKGNIIKDVVSGLSELQKHNIVHFELTPKNIMYFQEKDGYTESWKLIDFDTACFVGSYFLHYAKIKMNYSAPEVIRAYEKGIKIKADFAMDMFSFGLILYFLEIGHHYWDGENEEKKEEIISTKYLPLRNIGDPTACYVMKRLLDKRIPHRMTLEGFIQTLYYISESSKQKKLTNTSNNKFEPDDEIIEEGLRAKLTQVIENAVASRRKHFRVDDIWKIAQKLRGHSNDFKLQIWNNEDQKDQFISILKNQVHLYNRFLWIIVRYCAVKDRVVNRLTKKISTLYRDIIEINSTIKAGKSFNSHLSKLIMALKSRDNKKIQCELNKFADDPYLNLYSNDDTDITLSRWHYPKNKAYIVTSTEVGPREEIFVKKNGDLFEYFQSNYNSPEHFHLSNWKNKIKLAWGISVGVKYLHDQKIVHLDLRSENILLKYDEKEETLIPKISNFLWSREIYSGKNSVYPKIKLSSGEKVWKRWYDPDRLRNKKRFESSTPSDIYSLGLLFWEITWRKPNNLPFKDVPIKNLYNHLLNNHYEELPELPEDYRDWGIIIKNMWKFKAEDRYDIVTIESNMKKLSKVTDSEIQQNSN